MRRYHAEQSVFSGTTPGSRSEQKLRERWGEETSEGGAQMEGHLGDQEGSGKLGDPLNHLEESIDVCDPQCRCVLRKMGEGGG